ncbi:UDP-glucose 4-epimerase [compost metagenome]
MGYSVLDIVKTFEKVNSVNIPYIIAPRRSGDLDIYYANANKAKIELGWETQKTLDDMCRDCWNFIKNN